MPLRRVLGRYDTVLGRSHHLCMKEDKYRARSARNCPPRTDITLIKEANFCNRFPRSGDPEYHQYNCIHRNVSVPDTGSKAAVASQDHEISTATMDVKAFLRKISMVVLVVLVQSAGTKAPKTILLTRELKRLLI
jgi:hypothetical protein